MRHERVGLPAKQDFDVVVLEGHGLQDHTCPLPVKSGRTIAGGLSRLQVSWAQAHMFLQAFVGGLVLCRLGPFRETVAGCQTKEEPLQEDGQ